MPWHARLQIDYTFDATQRRSVARHRHQGPLRLLQSLYPEAGGICHNVLVHPPGGLVGGDMPDIVVHAARGSHGLLTTPDASRFYRSLGETARQHTAIRIDAGARLEWLPLEAICYSGCIAENRLDLNLAAGAELIGWDVTAFGLPAAGQPFETGSLLQHVELEGAWRERGRIAAGDTAMLDGPLGLAGRRCLASVFLCTGEALARDRRQRALDAARDVLATHALAASAGATSPNDRVVVVRVLAPLVEPAMDLLRRVRAVWRREMWQLEAPSPRIWST